MNRRFFGLLALFGGAAAGQKMPKCDAATEGMMWPSDVTGGAPKKACFQGQWLEVAKEPRRPKPRNGECPVCGTMAKPYVRPVAKAGEYVPCAPSHDGLSYSALCSYDEGASYGPMSRPVICAFCRCHYGQDAEK